MYNQLLQSVSQSGLSPLAYTSPALYASAGNESPAVSIMQQIQQGQQAGLVLGSAGLVGLTPQQQQQLAAAASANFYGSSPTSAYHTSQPAAYLHQAMFAAGPTAFVGGATGATQLPAVSSGAAAATGLSSTTAATAAMASANGLPLTTTSPLQSAKAGSGVNPILFGIHQQQQQLRQQQLQQIQSSEQQLHQQQQQQPALLGYGGGSFRQLQQQQQLGQPSRRQQHQQHQSDMFNDEEQDEFSHHQQNQQHQYQQSQQQALSQSDGQQQNQPAWMMQVMQQSQRLQEHNQQQQQEQQQQAALLVHHQLQKQQQQYISQQLQKQQQPPLQQLQPTGPRQQTPMYDISSDQAAHYAPGRIGEPTGSGLVQRDSQQRLLAAIAGQQQQSQRPMEAPQLFQRQQQQQQFWVLQQVGPQPQQQATSSLAASTRTTGGALQASPTDTPAAGAILHAHTPLTGPEGALAVPTPTTLTAAAVSEAGRGSGRLSTAAPTSTQVPGTGPRDAAPTVTALPSTVPFRAAIDWRATFTAAITPHEVLPPGHPSKGVSGLRELRLGALEVLLAETPDAANAAVDVLKSRMWDGIVAMDMEWKPDTVRGESNPIALLQLSSAGLVVVVRTLTCGLPEAFRTGFLEDSDVELVVAGWANNDEQKFEESFGLTTFWCKIADVQKVAKACGHSKTGVRALVQAVLEPLVGMPKSKKQSMSDWSAPTLQPEQLKYAVLDAGCVEHVFRCLEGKF